MERANKEKPSKRPGGGLKDRPQCERCGRPVKLDSSDYDQEEILCASCASESRTSEVEDYEVAIGWH